MAVIRPFRAIRPTQDNVSQIATRSYGSYTQNEREERLRNNPLSFLHIIDPGYGGLEDDISNIERFTLVRNRYLEFKKKGVFIQEAQPAYYVHRIVNQEGLEFTGIVAAASVMDYESGTIKKHEETIARREILFKEYLNTVGFNAESVLLAYPDNDALDAIIQCIVQRQVEYEFTASYGDTHQVWVVSNIETVQVIQSIFGSMSRLYIADGHHRSASSRLLAKDRYKSDKQAPHNFFMSYLIPESNVSILGFNRLIKNLNGLSKEAFLTSLGVIFTIKCQGGIYATPSGEKYCFGMYLDGMFYTLQLRESAYKICSSRDALDVRILQKTILEPILGIQNLRTDYRISYAHGKKGSEYVKKMVDSGEFAVGFIIQPITISELTRIADEGYTLPPKSTYIEPKLRSGILIYEF